jgi:hypothetical protein
MSPYAFCREFDGELEIQKLQKPRVKMVPKIIDWLFGWLSHYSSSSKQAFAPLY